MKTGQMDAKFLIKFLNDKDTRRVGWHRHCIDTQFETMPSDFVNFAEKDLQSKFHHKYINALSNAKRALDCQTDRLLKLLGYYDESQAKFWGFPLKIENIKKFEIIAPRVLNKINKTRNLMEHQYIKPKADQVEDFLDIVSLFLASTERYVSGFLAEVEYLNEINEEYKSCSEISVSLDSSKGRFTFERGLIPAKTVKLTIDQADSAYIDIFKILLKKNDEM